MALLSTKRTSMFLKSGATLPVYPANFLEMSGEFVVNPSPVITEYNRVSSKLGTTDSYADTAHVTITQSINHMMRSSNTAGTALDTPPEYGELLKICGFDETIVTTTLGQETVTYTNSQTPAKGSVVAFIDGNKYTLTNTVVGDATFNFEVGKAATIDANIQGFLDNAGVPIAEANPSVTLSTENLLIVSQADVMTAGGIAVSADKITITMGADIQELYALGLKQYDLTDYVIKVTASFFVDSTAYDDAINLINAETTEALVIKIGTNNTGALINGKSVYITADVAKASSFTDSIDKNKVKREFTWILRPNGSDVNISLKNGFFA